MTTYYTYDSATKRLNRAPDPATIDGRMIVHPSAEMCATIHAYPRGESVTPTPPEGKIAVPDGYELSSEGWAQKWRYVDAPAPAPRTFSKLKLYAALTNAGLWDALKTWLESQTVQGVNAWIAFSLAQDISEDYPLFEPWLAAAKSTLSITDEEAEAILAASVAD